MRCRGDRKPWQGLTPSRSPPGTLGWPVPACNSLALSLFPVVTQEKEESARRVIRGEGKGKKAGRNKWGEGFLEEGATEGDGYSQSLKRIKQATRAGDYIDDDESDEEEERRVRRSENKRRSASSKKRASSRRSSSEDEESESESDDDSDKKSESESEAEDSDDGKAAKKKSKARVVDDSD